MTTTENVTTQQIEQLQREAGEAGDEKMVRICRAAMPALHLRQHGVTRVHGGVALQQCVEAINAAEAMQ